MGMNAYTSQDIIEIDGRVITDMANGDTAVITYPNEILNMTTGKKGNSIATHNEEGQMADLVLRIIKGSPDDAFLNGKITAWKNRLDSFAPMDAVFTKTIKVNGGTINEITSLSFGIPSKPVEVKENVSADTEQAIAIYNIRFGNSNRTLA